MSSNPLTDEQLYGEPAKDSEQQQAADYCPYKNVRCMAWDHGCQAKMCIQEIEDEGND